MSDKFTENELTEGLIKASSEGAGGEVSRDGSNSDVVANVLSLANGDTEMISRRLGVSPEVAQQLADTVYNNSVNAIDNLNRSTNAKSLAAEFGGGVSAGLLDVCSAVSTISGFDGLSKKFSRGANNVRNFVNSIKGEDYEAYQRAKQLRELNYNHNSAVKEQEDIRNGMSSGLASLSRYGRDMIHSFNASSSADIAEGIASGIGYLAPSFVGAYFTGGTSTLAQLGAKGIAIGGAKLAAKNALAGSAMNLGGRAVGFLASKLGTIAGKTIGAGALLGAGSAESQALETVDNLTDEQLMNTPYYKAHINEMLEKSNGDPVEALKLTREGLETKVMNDSALKGAIAEGGASAILMGLNKIVGKTPGLRALAIEGPVTAEQQMLENRAISKLLNKGALTETETKALENLQARNRFSLAKTAKQYGNEFTDEALQEGSSTYATNTVEKENINENKDVNEGVGESAMQGGIAGIGTKGGVTLSAPVKAILSNSTKAVASTLHKKAPVQNTQTAQQQNPVQSESVTQQVDSLTSEEKSEKVDNLSTEVVNKVNTLQDTINSDKSSEEDRAKATEELNDLKTTFAPILATEEEKQKATAIVNQHNSASSSATADSINNSKTKKELINSLGNVLSEQKAALQSLENQNASNDEINQLKDSMKNTAQEIVNLYEASHYSEPDDTENQDESTKGLQLNNYLVNSNLDDMVADENSVVNNAYKLVGRDIIKGKDLNVNPSAEKSLDINSKIINTRHIAANDDEYANEDVQAARDIHNSIDTMLGTLKVWNFAENLKVDGDNKRIVKDVDSSKQNEDILDVYENKIKSLKNAREFGRLILSRKDASKLKAIDRLIDLKLDLRDRITNPNFELTDSEAEALKSGQTSLNEFLEAKFADEYKIANTALKAYKHSAQNNEQGYNEAISEIKDIISKNGKVAAELIEARNQAHMDANNPNFQETPESAHAGIPTPHSGSWTGSTQQKTDGTRFYKDSQESLNALHTALNNYTKAIETYNEISSYTNHLPTNRIQAKDAFESGKEPVIVPPDLYNKNHLAVSNSFLKAFGLTRNTGSENDEEYSKRFNSVMSVVPNSIKRKWAKINQNAYTSLEDSYKSKNGVEETDKALARKREALGKLNNNLGKIVNTLTNKDVNLSNSDLSEDTLSKNFEAIKAILIGMDYYGFKPKSATDESIATGVHLKNLMNKLNTIPKGNNKAVDDFTQWYSEYSKGTNEGGISNPEETIKYIDDNFADDSTKVADLFKSKDSQQFLKKGISNSASLTSTSNNTSDTTAASIRDVIFGSSPDVSNATKSALPKVDVGFVQPERDVNVENAAVKEINKKFTEKSRGSEYDAKNTNRKKNILTKVFDKLGDKGSRLFDKHSPNPKRASNIFRHFGNLICAPELERETSALATFWNNFDIKGDKTLLNRLFELIKDSDIRTSIHYSDIQSTIESLIEKSDFSISEKEFVKQFFSEQEGQYQSIYNSIANDVNNVIAELAKNSDSLENALSWDDKRAYIPLIAKDGSGNLVPNPAMIAGLTMATMASYVRFINNVPADPFLGDKDWDLVSPKDKQSIEQDIQDSMLTDPITNEINYLFRDIMHISENDNADSAATALSGLGGVGLKALASDDANSGAGVVQLVRVKTPNAFINGTNESVTRVKFFKQNSSLIMTDKTNVIYSDYQADLISRVFSSKPNEDFIIGDTACSKFLNKDGTIIDKFKKILHTFVGISDKEAEAIQNKFKESFVPDMNMYKTIEKWGPDATACFLLGISNKNDLANMSTDLRASMLSAYSQYMQSFQDMARVKKIRLGILEKIASNPKPKDRVVNGITIDKNFVERFRNNDVTSEELQKLKSVLGQHFLHQMTRVDRFNAIGHSAVGDKIKRLYETNNDAPLTIDGKDQESYRIFTRALSQAFGNDIWKEEVQDSVNRINGIISSIKKKMQSNPEFAKKVQKFVNNKATTKEITDVFSAMKVIDDDGNHEVSYNEPVALQGVKELLQYVINGTVNSNLYIEFDGKSCGPATQYARYGSEISLHDLEVAWRSGNFFGYPADLRQLKRDIADLEAKTDRTEAEDKQLNKLKDIVANDGYMIMAKESVKYCQKVKERAFAEGSDTPSAKAFNALDSVMKKTVLRMGTMEVKASIPLTETLSKGFRALAKLIGTPMVYGAGSAAEATTIAQGILRGIDYKFYKTVKYLESENKASNSATANEFLNAFATANDMSVEDVKNYFNEILTLTSATTDVSGKTLDDAIIHMSNVSSGNTLIKMIMDKNENEVSANQKFMWPNDSGILAEVSLATVARAITWNSSDNLAVQSAVQTFITEPMNIGANKAFPPSAKETVNAQTALSGAMGMLNQFVVANVVNVMTNNNGGHFNATMEKQMFENPAIQKILKSTSLPHSDGDTRFYNYKFGHDANTFTTNMQNTSIVHVKINGQDYTISTKPTVMKAKSMGVTSQPGGTQGSGDGDIMARVVNKLYSLTANLANKYGKNGKQTFIGSMFDGINVFLGSLRNGKPVDAIGEALSESLKQNISVQTLEGINEMIQLFNEVPELLISPSIGLASNRAVALGFGYKIAEAIESLSENNPKAQNAAKAYRNRLSEANSLEDRAEAIISLLNSFTKLVKIKAKRHEAKIAVLFGTPKSKNGVVDFLHPDNIERNADALPSSLQNFDTMEFGHSTTHESTKRAMDDAKAPLSLSHTFFIYKDGKLRIGTKKDVEKMKNVTPLVTRDEFIKSTTPEMIAEYCKTRQEGLLNSMQLYAILDNNIKANCLNFPEFKKKGISQKKLEDSLLTGNITVADFKNYLDSLTTGIKVAFNSSGKKQDAKGFTQKLHELGNIARQIYFSATSGTRAIIDSAKVVSFDFTGYASKGEVEQNQYIRNVLKCDEETANKYQNMLSKIKDFSNIKGLHLGVDAILVTSKAMDDLQSTDAQKRADAIENITEIVNHEVSHMGMLDAIESAYTFGRKSENELINELKTKYSFDDANARIEAGKIIALRQLNDQVEISAEHMRIAYFKVLFKTFDVLCSDSADIRAQFNIPDNVPLQKTFEIFGKRLIEISNIIINNGDRNIALEQLSDLYKDLATLEDKSDTNYKKTFNDVLAKQFENMFQTEFTQELRDGFEEISLVSTSGNRTGTVQETLTWFLNQKNFYDLVYRKGKNITKLADNNFRGYSIDYDWVKKLFGTRISNLLGNIHRGLMEFFNVLRQKCGLNPGIGDADMFQLLVTASQANLSNNFFTSPKGGITIGNDSVNAMTGSNTSSKKHNVKDLDSFINTYPDSFNKAMNGIQMVNTALDNLNRRGLTPFTENQRAEFDYTLHSLLIGLGSGLPNTFKYAYLMDKGLKENRDKLSKDELDYITNLEKEISDPLTRSFAITALVSAKPQMLDKLNTKGITPPKVEADLNIEKPLADMINTLAGEVNSLTDPDVDNLTLKQAVENYKKDSWDDFNSLNFKVSPLKIGGRVKSNPVNNLFNRLDKGTSNLIRKSARVLESVGGKNKVSQTIRKVGSVVDSMYATSEYEKLSGEDFYDNLERWADTNLDQNSFLQNFVKQQIREYTNHTRGTNSYHNIKKISKNKVQQKAEALRSITKIQLKKHCKDCKNWKAANRLFAMGSFFKAKLTRDDLNKLLQNPNEIQKGIYEYPVPVEVSNAITRLVTFIQTGTCKDPENLIRNTYAISQLYNESFDVVNRLYTLYTLEYLRQKRPDDFKDLKDFIVKDTKGEQLGYINNLLSNLYRTDLRKIANAPIIPGQHNHAFNFIEGHTPTVQEYQMIPTRDLDLVAKLKQEGWKEQKVSSNGVHYMVQDIVVQSFHSGALQVVNNTAMGIDIDNGFANNTIPYKDGMTSNKDEIVVPCYYHNAKKMHYEVIPVQPVEEKELDSVIGDWMARYEIESNVDSANDMCMAELRKLYDKDPTSKRNINLSKLVDEKGKIIDSEFKKANLSKYQRKAIERLFKCPRIIPVIKKYFPDGLVVRRDLIDDALGMESASIVDIYTGNNNLPKIVNDSLKMFCNVFGGERGAMHLEAELRAVTKVAKNSQVIKSVVVPVANFTANVIQMWMTGIPINIIAKGYITKGKECNRYIALTREYADLQLESLNGKDVGTRMDKIIEEIQGMSIAPVINLGEFNTIQDDSDGDLTDTGSYFIKAINKIKQSKEKFGKAGELLDELATTERTLLYKCEERTTQYGDFIAKSICYDYWKNKYNEKEAIFRVTSEFVDYDFMPSRCREWLEKIGWGWYWNYKLRMSKVMMRMIRDNPFRSLMFLILPPTLFDIDLDTPFKDSALGKLLGMGPSLMSSMGFGHLFGLKNYIPIAGMF